MPRTGRPKGTGEDLAAHSKRGTLRKRHKPQPKPVVKAPPLKLVSNRIELLPPEDTMGGIPGFDPTRMEDGFTFDAVAARGAMEWWQQSLVHTKGPLARSPFWLEHWQQSIIGNLFGWKRPDGTRRFREVFLGIPRKNGKSPMAAGMLLSILFQGCDFGDDIVGAASNFNQAALVFEYARMMVLLNDELRSQCTVYAGQAKSIQRKEDHGFSTYRVVSRTADGLHGLNLAAAVIDELHTMQKRDLVDAIRTGIAAKPNPLLIYLTTSDSDRESICNEKWNYARQVRDGTVDDPDFLPIIYEADLEDDYKDPKIWSKANPNLGVSVSTEYMERESKIAAQSVSDQRVFERFHLNIRTHGKNAGINMPDWDECPKRVDAKGLLGVPCVAGLDLASTNDFTALCLMFPNYQCLWWYWMPEKVVNDRKARAGLPWDDWVGKGYLELTDGNQIDYATVIQRIVEIHRDYPITKLAIDRLYQGAAVGQTLAAQHGLEVIAFGQGYLSMAAPVQEFDRLIGRHVLNHGNNPISRWMASNVSWSMDSAGNRKPDKAESGDKIDGIVSAVMALGIQMLQEKEKAPSRYNAGEGLRTL